MIPRDEGIGTRGAEDCGADPRVYKCIVVAGVVDEELLFDCEGVAENFVCPIQHILLSHTQCIKSINQPPFTIIQINITKKMIQED